MEPNVNLTIQEQLRKAMEQLQAYGVSSNPSSAQGTSSDSEFVNSVFGLVQNGQQAIEGNDEQRVKSTVNIIEGLLGMISFSKNQVAAANKEVKTNSDAINKNEQAADKKAQEVQEAINKITASIAANTNNIENALSEIEKLGGDNSDLAKAQEMIQAQLDIIDEKKAELNDPKKRDAALKSIQMAADVINMLVGNIGNIQATIETQNAVVASSVENISGLITESATKIAEGVADIQKYIQNGTVLGTKATQTAVQGGTDVPTGNAEIKAGEAINSNGISALASGGQGAKLIIDGNQRVSAGQTRIQGGTSNLAKLTQSIGKMGQDISSIVDFTNAIGKVGEGVTSLAEQYSNAVQPYIEATGTWDVDAIAEANALLQADVKTLTEQKETNTDKPVQTQNADVQKEFLDTKKFRTAFGI